MKVGQVLDALKTLPVDAEVFMHLYDSDGEAMILTVDEVADDPENGILVKAGKEVGLR